MNFVQFKRNTLQTITSTKRRAIFKSPSSLNQAQRKTWSQAICCYPASTSEMLDEKDLDRKIHQLNNLCLSHNTDSYKTYQNRCKGLVMLEEVVFRLDMKKVKNNYMVSLIWCTLSCTHNFFVRIGVGPAISSMVKKTSDSQGNPKLLRLKQALATTSWRAQRAMRVYERLIALFQTKYFPELAQSVIIFCNESGLWYTEYLCIEFLNRLLGTTQQNSITVHTLLDVAESTSLYNINGANQLLRVLYHVFDKYQSTDMDELLTIRLLTMYHHSLVPRQKDKYNYKSMKQSLEVCIQSLFNNLNNPTLLNIIQSMLQWTLESEISDEAILDFGNIIEIAAYHHKVFLYRDSLHHEAFLLVLKMIASENRLHSLLGNRLMHQLMDRNQNRTQFDTPRIFFQDTHYNVTVSTYYSEDKQFIKENRDLINNSLILSVQHHGQHRINLESTYTSMAIFLAEIPCGYLAASIACTAMTIQELAMSHEKWELAYCHRVHATILSIMSLICWVHNASIFYEYINAVLTRRAQQAPHLNPPLRVSYEYAQHHVLWNKPELFFEDWEVRYGLWKCFKSKKHV